MSKDNKNTEVVTEEVVPETVTMTKEEVQKLFADALAQAKEELKNEAEVTNIAASKAGSGVTKAIRDNEKKMHELVEIELFYDGEKYKDDVFVRVNNYTAQIKRGEKVKVPRFVKEVLDASVEQERVAATYRNGKQAEYERKRKEIEG